VAAAEASTRLELDTSLTEAKATARAEVERLRAALRVAEQAAKLGCEQAAGLTEERDQALADVDVLRRDAHAAGARLKAELREAQEEARRAALALETTEARHGALAMGSAERLAALQRLMDTETASLRAQLESASAEAEGLRAKASALALLEREAAAHKDAAARAEDAAKGTGEHLTLALEEVGALRRQSEDQRLRLQASVAKAREEADLGAARDAALEELRAQAAASTKKAESLAAEVRHERLWRPPRCWPSAAMLPRAAQRWSTSCSWSASEASTRPTRRPCSGSWTPPPPTAARRAGPWTRAPSSPRGQRLCVGFVSSHAAQIRV